MGVCKLYSLKVNFRGVDNLTWAGGVYWVFYGMWIAEIREKNVFPMFVKDS